ncbi:MAG: hypothetical protein K6T65_11750 [Peptococcaceae bacterium]|nr:hypothetical protein [Peptococcaceae bacterium]
MVDWLFSYAFWDLNWLEVLVLSPFAVNLAYKLIIAYTTRGKYYDNPDYAINGNDNIYRNFWDYM